MDISIGIDKQEIDTPALLIDLDMMEQNIQIMADFCADAGTSLRPHAKTHKSPIIAHKQIAAGAIGITCAKLGEAEVMVQAGIRDILIANQIVGKQKIRRLAHLSRHADLIVAVDDSQNLQDIGEAMVAVDSSVRVVVEVDTGMGRCGTMPGTPTLELVRQITRTEGVRFCGLMGYEGHAVALPTFTERKAVAEESIARLVETKHLLEKHGIPVPMMTGGGTGTYNITGKHPEMTEIEAGSYVFMDAMYQSVGGLHEPFGCALTLLTTVVSRPAKDRLITDAGLKVASREFGLPRAKNIPELQPIGLSEEHGRFEIVGEISLKPGDTIELIPTHCCTTVNLHDRYYGIRNGVVETIWPIAARGKAQ